MTARDQKTEQKIGKCLWRTDLLNLLHLLDEQKGYGGQICPYCHSVYPAHETITCSCTRPHPAPADKRVPYVECNHSYSSCPINWDAHNRAIARQAREDVLNKIIPTLGQAIQTDVSDNDYVMIEDLKSTIESLRGAP